MTCRVAWRKTCAGYPNRFERESRIAHINTMHKSSLLKAEFFLKHYGESLPESGGLHRVLEIGSKSYESQDSYKPLFPEERFKYTGLDIEAGPNVDLVPAHNFLWNEIEDETFDLCISGQTFEHNPFFWVTFSEIARIPHPEGLCDHCPRSRSSASIDLMTAGDFIPIHGDRSVCCLAWCW